MTICEKSPWRVPSCEFVKRADGISEIEGKAARVAASEQGRERVSNSCLRSISTRSCCSSNGQTPIARIFTNLTMTICEKSPWRVPSCEFVKRADGISEIEGKAARVAASEQGRERVSNSCLRLISTPSCCSGRRVACKTRNHSRLSNTCSARNQRLPQQGL